MNLIRCFWQTMIPSPPARRHMCIRCDEVRQDVPAEGLRCASCQAIVHDIAINYPDVYLHYLANLNAAKKDFE